MGSLIGVANVAGLWVGLLLSLLIFSRIFGDHLLARLAQYLLVGASLGYLAVLLIQNVLRPRLIQPLLQDPITDPWLIVPLLLGVLLFFAGLDRIVQQAKPKSSAPALWRRWLYMLGMVPVALVVGMAIATAIVGTVQGTLLPQFFRAAQRGFPRGGTNGQLVTGLLTLLVTTGALLHLYVETPNVETPNVKVPAGAKGAATVGGRLASGLLGLWTWVGKRALWLAAGMIFARLIASRLSLLIARFEYFYQAVERIGLW